MEKTNKQVRQGVTAVVLGVGLLTWASFEAKAKEPGSGAALDEVVAETMGSGARAKAVFAKSKQPAENVLVPIVPEENAMQQEGIDVLLPNALAPNSAGGSLMHMEKEFLYKSAKCRANAKCPGVKLKAAWDKKSNVIEKAKVLKKLAPLAKEKEAELDDEEFFCKVPEQGASGGQGSSTLIIEIIEQGSVEGATVRIIIQGSGAVVQSRGGDGRAPTGR